MDPIVVQMTGLLLLVPDPQANGPMHVLFSEPVNLPTHVSWIAFRGHRADYCSYYGEVGMSASKPGICVVDMAGWSLVVGTGASNPAKRPPPGSTFNVTEGSGGMAVEHAYLGNTPGRRIRSRVTLHGIPTTRTCSLAKWKYTPFGADRPKEDVRLANLLTWTINDFVGSKVSLTRTRLDVQGAPETQRLATLESKHSTNGSNLELIIMHVPLDEASQFLESIGVPPRTRGLLRSSRPDSVRARASSGARADHFDAHYNLLGGLEGAPAAKRPIPVSTGKTQETCDFGVLDIPISHSGLETMSCMVATALPRS